MPKAEATDDDASGHGQQLICPDCGAAVRLLNKKVEAERVAYDKGFRYICTECEEVIE